MFNRLIQVVGISMIGIMVLTGCTFSGDVLGQGQIETAPYQFSGFDVIEIGGAFEFEITCSDGFAVTITADQEHVRVEQNGRVLQIGRKDTWRPMFGSYKAVINLPVLSRLNVDGASKGYVCGFSAENIKLNVSGASQLDLQEMENTVANSTISGASRLTGKLSATDATFDISGASRVELEGDATRLDIQCSGASRVELSGLPATDSDVLMSGASSGTVNLSGELNADLSGASRLDLIGKALINDLKTSGSSKVHRK